MKTESLSVGRAGYVPVSLGKVGEAQATRIDIDVREWDKVYPGATYLLFVSPPEPTAPYLAKVTHENGVVSWVLESEDTTTAGNGTIELILTQGNARIKSVTWSTMMMTSPSSSEAGDAPQSHPTWWEDALDKIEDAKQEAISEIDGTFDSEVAEGKAALEASGAAQQAAIENKGKNTLDSIPEDYAMLANDVSSLKDTMVTKAPAIECEASGAIITVDDAAAMPVHGLASNIAFVDGGSSSVTAKRTGKNLYNGDDKSFFNRAHVTPERPLQPGTYSVGALVTSEDTDATVSVLAFLDKSEKIIARATLDRGIYNTSMVTISETCNILRFCASDNVAHGEGDSCTWKQIMIAEGGSATPYEAYDAQTLTATLPEPVYGGTLDWMNGTLTSMLDVDGNELDEPKVFHLAAQQMDTLKGVNHIWSNTGNTSVVYAADTKTWGKDASVSLIGATENGMVATKNYSIGDFIVDKETLTMYRATKAIAKGEAITPGTNCAATTMVEQLTAIYTILNA